MRVGWAAKLGWDPRRCCGQSDGQAGMARRDGLSYRPGMPGIVIIGAGFGGIGMAIALKQAGFDDHVTGRDGRKLTLAAYTVSC
jgi:NADPH-dependent 2,4-dienoyl-CoA reductase/sulfur reductase-like enzyme